MALDKRTRARGESAFFLAIVAGILVALNVVGVFMWTRFDATEKRLFSLSDGSKRLASRLTDRMEVTAYFTANLPPPFNATERYVRDILAEYEAASKGRLRVRYVNPDTDERRQEAEREGVTKVSHQAIENDGVSVREGYRGIVFRYLGEKKVIPVVEDTSGLEYRISMLLKELTGERRPIGVLTGHEGPTPTKGLSGLRDAMPTYEFREVAASAEIPSEIRALLIVQPENEITETELRYIDQFVMRGGSLGVFGGTMTIDPENREMNARQTSSGINRLLQGYGIQMGENILADARCGRAPLQTQMGFPIPVPYPPVPIVTFDEAQRRHPVLFRLDQSALPFTSTVWTTDRARAEREVRYRTLATSSEQSWVLRGETVALAPKLPQEWQVEGRTGPFQLMIAAEGKPASAFTGGAEMSADGPTVDAPARAERSTRILVTGTAAFMRDEFLPRAGADGQRDLNSALALAMNAIDWLAQDADLIAIRAKNVEEPSLDVPQSVKAANEEFEQAARSQDRGAAEAAVQKHKEALEAWERTKATYRWANMLGLPALFAIFGLIRWTLRRRHKANVKL